VFVWVAGQREFVESNFVRFAVVRHDGWSNVERLVVGTVIGTPSCGKSSFIKMLGAAQIIDSPASSLSRVTFENVTDLLDDQPAAVSFSMIDTRGFFFDNSKPSESLGDDERKRFVANRAFDQKLLRRLMQGLPDSTVLSRQLDLQRVPTSPSNALSHLIIFAHARRLIRFSDATPAPPSNPSWSIWYPSTWFGSPQAASSGSASTVQEVKVDEARLQAVLDLYEGVRDVLADVAYGGNEEIAGARVVLVVTHVDTISNDQAVKNQFMRSVGGFFMKHRRVPSSHLHFVWKDCTWDPNSLREHDAKVAKIMNDLDPESIDFYEKLAKQPDIFSFDTEKCTNAAHSIHPFPVSTVKEAKDILALFVKQVSSRH
jgi:hypothetical protein